MTPRNCSHAASLSTETRLGVRTDSSSFPGCRVPVKGKTSADESRFASGGKSGGGQETEAPPLRSLPRFGWRSRPPGTSRTNSPSGTSLSSHPAFHWVFGLSCHLIGRPSGTIFEGNPAIAARSRLAWANSPSRTPDLGKDRFFGSGLCR
jgi:hypothetical protein